MREKDTREEICKVFRFFTDDNTAIRDAKTVDKTGEKVEKEQWDYQIIKVRFLYWEFYASIDIIPLIIFSLSTTLLPTKILNTLLISFRVSLSFTLEAKSSQVLTPT